MAADECVKLDEKGRIMLNNGLCHLNCSNYENAKTYFLVAIEKYNNVDAMNALGVLFERMNDDNSAEKYFLMAHEKGNVDAICNMGHYHKKRNNIPEAIKYYSLYVDNFEPTWDEEQLMMARLHLNAFNKMS